MPSFGGYAGVFPLRFGGGKPPLEHRVNSILSQLGTAYDTDIGGLVWLRAMALGRCLWDVWESNQRLANQWDPKRMTDFLGRWEKIYALPVSPSDSLSARRSRVGVAMARSGFGDGSTVYSTCLAYLGASVFVSIVTNSSSTANVWTPSGWPMGSHPVVTTTQPDWYSTIAHIDILCQQPSTMTDGEYYATVASVLPALDAILPAWVTVDIVRDGSRGAGFYLDDNHNLDNERFDV